MNVIKRLFSVALGVLMAIPAFAQFTVGSLTYTPSSGDACYVSAVAKTATTVAVPAYVESGGTVYTVTAIGKSAFEDCTKLSALTMPATVKSIQAQAFRKCTSLVSVVIPPSVTTISSEAFSGCSALTTAYIGHGVSSIGGNAFAGTKLRDVYITAQKAPTIQSNTFPAAINVYVQGDAKSSYQKANHWSSYGEPAQMPLPTAMTTYNNVTIWPAGPLKAEFGQTASRAYLRRLGETFTFTNALTGTNIQPAIFWTSSAPNLVTVDAAGKLTVRAMGDTPARLTAQSIYAGGPKIEITINDCTLVDGFYYSITDEADGRCMLLGPESNTIQTAVIPSTVNIKGKEYKVSSLDALTFYNCTALTSVTMPETVTSLGYRSFYGAGMKKIKLPTSLKTIGGDAFKQSKLTEIEIPNSVTSMGSYCFESCTDLSKVTIGSRVPLINGYTFSGCSSLTSIVLPPSVKSVENYAFCNSGLTEVWMGPNVTKIGDYAFAGSTPLANIYITAQTPPTLSSNAFTTSVYDNAKLHLQGTGMEAKYRSNANWNKFKQGNVLATSAPASMETYNGLNIHSTKPKTALAGQTATGSLLLQAGKSANFTTTLKPAANETLEQSSIFWDSTNTDCIYMTNAGALTMKVIPQEPVTLTAKSIYAGTPVIEITVAGGYPVQDGDNEPLYYSILDEEARTCAVVAPENSELTTVVIPAKTTINGKEYTVTEIASMAFYGCSSLTSVTLPTTMKAFRYKAFCRTGIKKITIPSSVTTIGGDAFKETPLESIALPNSAYLSSWVFDQCKNLSSVTLGNGITDILGYNFQDCTSLSSIVLPPSVSKINAYAFKGCSGLTKVYMGPNVKTISADAFKDCSGITDIYITAQAAPAIAEATFPASVYENATLHLQGEGTESVYRKNAVWNKFKRVSSVLLTPPVDMQTYNNVNVFSSNKLTATGNNTATTSILLAAGKTAQYYTTLTQDVSTLTAEEKAVFNKVYWRSAAPDNVSANISGVLTVRDVPSQPVKVTAESMYAAAPKIEVTVNGALPAEGQNLYYTILSEEAATCAVAAPVDAAITEAVIPETVNINGKDYTVTQVASLAFFQCKNLTSVTLPETMQSFGYRAFYQTGLKSIKLPTSLTTIGGDAFKETPLTSIEIPNSVTAIGSYAFDGCKDLESVTLSNKVSVISGYTFQNCSSLSSIVIPPSVTNIQGYSFKGCTELRSIYLGPNVKSISAESFTGTENLADIYITAQTPPSIAAKTFPDKVLENAVLHLQGDGTEGVYRSNELWNGFKKAAVPMTPPTRLETYNGDDIHPSSTLKADAGKTATHTFLLKQNGNVTYTTTLTFPTGTTPDLDKIFWSSSAPRKVFVDHNGIITNKVVLDGEVKITGESIYAGSPKLEVTITGCSRSESGDEPLYYSVVSEEKGTCAVAASDDGYTEITIPEKATIAGKEYIVTEVGKMAFYQKGQLQKVNIPSTVRKIGYRSFYGAGLTELNLPESVDTIVGASFERCKFTKVVLPNSISYMGGYSFSACYNLEEIQLSHHIPDIGTYTFQNCRSLKSIVLPPSVRTIGENAFLGCGKLEKIYMGPNISSIGAGAFNTFYAYTSGGAKTSALKDIYITRSTAPTTSATAFPEALFAAVTLHLQVSDKSSFKNHAVWGQFTKEIQPMPAPVQLSTFNRNNIYSNNPLKADAGKTATHSYLLREGGSVRYETSLTPASDATTDALDLADIFWTSTDPQKVYVGYDGTIVNRTTLDTPVKITGKSIYNNTPALEVTITGCTPYSYENGTLYYTITSEEDATCEVASADTDIEYAAIPEIATISGKDYTVTAIGQLAFYQCTNLTSVSIPETVNYIGYRSFYSAGLTELNLPTSVTRIHGATFEYCKFKKVVIPNSVTSMGGYTFQGCSELEEIELSHSTPAIGSYTFQNCGKLKSIVLPPGVTSIGEYAFNQCKALKSVYIGPKVGSINNNAFAGCTALTDVYITRQNAPTVGATPFPTTIHNTARLHLQGSSANTSYKNHSYWSNFTQEAHVMKPHVEMRLDITDADTPAPAQIRRRAAEAVTTTAEHIYGVAGQTHYRTATLLDENGSEVDIPKVFWSSDDTSKVYVDHNGTINLVDSPELHNPVTVTAQSLYADAPTRTVTIDHEMMTGLQDIFDDEDSENVDFSEGRVYTLEGIFTGRSVQDLEPGIYILRQGDKAYKIYIK